MAVSERDRSYFNQPDVEPGRLLAKLPRLRAAAMMAPLATASRIRPAQSVVVWSLKHDFNGEAISLSEGWLSGRKHWS